MSTGKGIIYGLGLGPGDPDLMSVKADRILRKSSHVAYFRKKGRKGHARTIVDTLLAENVVEYAMEYPVTTEIALKITSWAKSLCP
ncbi:MAG: SAM-dependent methyltransferase, partial [Paracoccaceae bacterium]